MPTQAAAIELLEGIVTDAQVLVTRFRAGKSLESVLGDRDVRLGWLHARILMLHLEHMLEKHAPPR